MGILDALLVLATLAFVIFIPGWVICEIIGATYSRRGTRTVVRLALGLVFLLFVGIGLSQFALIDAGFLSLVYATVSGVFIAMLWKRRLKVWHSIRSRSSLSRILRKGIIIGAPYLLGLFLWYPYLGFHASDPGLHAFWGGWVVSTNHLPDYNVAGASLPSILFVFGPHLLLATISLISNVPIVDSLGIVLFFFYSTILLAVQSITIELTKSEMASMFAALFYVTSQIPAARILLGNMPDMIGYFL